MSKFITNSFDFQRDIEVEIFEFIKSGLNIKILPIVHNSVIYSQFTSKVIYSHEFDCVALEFPFQLEKELLKSMDRLPNLSIILNSEDLNGQYITNNPRNQIYLVHPGEAIFWAGREAISNGIPLFAIDNLQYYKHETIQLSISADEIATLGWIKTLETNINLINEHIRDPIHGTRSKKFADNLITILSDGTEINKILFVCGGAHLLPIAYYLTQKGFTSKNPNLIKLFEKIDFHINEIKLNKLKSKSTITEWIWGPLNSNNLHYHLVDLPYIVKNFAQNPIGFNYSEMVKELFLEAGQKYTQNFDDEIGLLSYLKMMQYLRNLSYVSKSIIPKFSDIIYTSKGLVDDDFAYELFKLAVKYDLFDDHQDHNNSFNLPKNLEEENFIKITFRRRYRRVIQKIDQEVNDSTIPSENYVGEWKDIWDEFSKFGYVSYPPEDEFIEKYLDKLRGQINSILAEENSSTLEFEGSMEDGIDYRETVRRYTEGKIYVKKLPKIVDKIGSIIVQFIEEPINEENYNSHSTLFAEHENESHLSVITTSPGLEFIGPGICRVKYAALISQFPPNGYPRLISKSNEDLKLRLVEAAMNMSLSKIIGFIASKPPNYPIRQYAFSHGFRLIYIPMGKLSNLSLHRLRTMHLLAHRDLRDIAKEYIGF